MFVNKHIFFKQLYNKKDCCNIRRLQLLSLTFVDGYVYENTCHTYFYNKCLHHYKTSLMKSKGK